MKKMFWNRLTSLKIQQKLARALNTLKLLIAFEEIKLNILFLINFKIYLEI